MEAGVFHKKPRFGMFAACKRRGLRFELRWETMGLALEAHLLVAAVAVRLAGRSAAAAKENVLVVLLFFTVALDDHGRADFHRAVGDDAYLGGLGLGFGVHGPVFVLVWRLVRKGPGRALVDLPSDGFGIGAVHVDPRTGIHVENTRQTADAVFSVNALMGFPNDGQLLAFGIGFGFGRGFSGHRLNLVIDAHLLDHLRAQVFTVGTVGID